MKNLRQIAKQSKASQDWFELWQLLEIADRLEPQFILEIGVHKGYLCKTWREAFPDAAVVGIENNTSELDFTDFWLIEGDSKDPHVRERARSIGEYDLVFIDGDHTFEGVKLDWNYYGNLVRPGGIVAFHDTRRKGEHWIGHVEVRKLFNLLRKNNPSVEFWGLSEQSPGTGVLFL